MHEHLTTEEFKDLGPSTFELAATAIQRAQEAIQAGKEVSLSKVLKSLLTNES